ncbi:HAD-IC family P-type ATPase [Bradyrhizobium cytisi]|uniref:HAD-IC family P-type ATPase n=1 Tax=Bradyrhizobium cytisi TaxID=515489 RepID=UPI001FECF128|nr:HAD-IC family P-type ATPase [Bradyrhizobium cytisi]
MIERLPEVDHVILDKTGTLTLPDLDGTNAADIPAGVFALAGRLALSSHHPVAAAVARAPGVKPPIIGTVEEAGQGVRVIVDGVEIRLGLPSFCGAEALVSGADLGPESSIVAFSKGSEKFILSRGQGLRPDASAVVGALKARNIGIDVLSGDREPAVRAAAHALGMLERSAGVTPADKIARIEELKRCSTKVLMVGDGMNDAPSLAAAHVSMSPISAAHLSQATADLVFLGRPLAPVVAAIDAARKALQLMRQNFWLAIGYNVMAVPICCLSGDCPSALNRGSGGCEASVFQG